MLDIPTYSGPADPTAITRDELLEALVFLIAVEPNPDDDEIGNYGDYLVRMAPWDNDIAQANQTLRLYAAQRQPCSLEMMRTEFAEILKGKQLCNDDMALAVAGSALSQAWNGVGPWRT